MNNPARTLAVAFLLLAGFSLAGNVQAQGRKNSAGEEFFIVSSVDQAKSQLLLKKPTEVTVLLKIGDTTQYLDENKKPLHLSDLRAGDAVWVISTVAKDGQPTGVRIRKGPMTIADLHRLYLDYPSVH